MAKEGTGFEAESDIKLWFQSNGGAASEETMTPTYASTAHTPSDALSKATSGRKPINIDSQSRLFHVALLERNIIPKAHRSWKIGYCQKYSPRSRNSAGRRRRENVGRRLCEVRALK